MHRIWGIIDRKSYAEFWINVIDLFAIATGLEFWHDLISAMFDVAAWYWNILWGGFIAMGGVVFGFGVKLLQTENAHDKGV